MLPENNNCVIFCFKKSNTPKYFRQNPNASSGSLFREVQQLVAIIILKSVVGKVPKNNAASLYSEVRQLVMTIQL